jgi:hypothetical protein
MNLALLARLEGDPARAGVALAEALAVLRASGDDAGVAQALAATGRLETLHGDAERARAALRESLAIRRRLGDVRSVGLTLGLLAELERDRAPALLSRALVMFREAGDRPGVLWMLLALARLGRDADARLQEALAICEALGAVGMRAWTLTLLAGAQPDRAPELIAEARREFERCGDGWGIERCEALAKRVQRRATTIPTHEPSHDTFG